MWKKVKCISTLIMKELKKKKKNSEISYQYRKKGEVIDIHLWNINDTGLPRRFCVTLYFYSSNWELLLSIQYFMYLLQNWNSCLDSVSLWSFVLIVSWSTVWAINEEVLLSLFLEWTYWYYLNLVNMLLKLTEMVQISISSLTYLLDTYLFLNCGSIFNILF